MSMPGIKRYTFMSAEQWKSGASRQFAFEADAVGTSAKYSPMKIAETSSDDRTAAITPEYCAKLIWLRKSRELVRNTNDGLRIVERLGVGSNAHTWTFRGLASGKSNLWLYLRRKGDATSSRIIKYDTRHFSGRQIDISERPVLAMCTDRRDGVWVLVGGDGQNAEAIRVSVSGEIARRISLGARLEKAAIDCSCDGKRLVVLDHKPQVDPCDTQLGWRIWLLELCPKGNAFEVIYVLPKRDLVCHSDSPKFRPQLLAIDCKDGIHVLQKSTGELWTLDFDGYVLRQHSRTLANCDLPAAGLAADTALAVSARTGIFRLVPTTLAESTSEEYQPTYVSPTMTSPDGDKSGWLRADIEVDLQDGAIIEVNVATSNDKKLAEQVDQILDNDSIPRATQLGQIESRLTWSDDLSKRYRANGSPVRRIHVPLHSITETFIWLRIRVFTESMAQVPRIFGMRVYYPNISYLQYLPAVYRENETAAEFLRSFLGIFESLFGNLDTELAELPARIDPKTAPDDWLPYLLRWLGFPAAPELSPRVQRKLLKAAPTLLKKRGTIGGLEMLLAIVTGADFHVIDSGQGPAPWVLPEQCRPGAGSRLGRGTLVLSQTRPAFRLGKSSILDSGRLGYQKADSASLFLRRHALVEVRITAERPDRQELRELLERYLPYFIPAHCRYTLRFVAARELQGYGRLDDDLRLADERPPRLGDASRIGNLYLGAAMPADLTGDPRLLDIDLYLS